MLKKITIITYILLFFNFNSFADENEKYLKVGLLAPFSGEYKNLGQSIMLSLQLALDEIGDENDAKLLAIKIANLDEKTKPITFGKNKKKLLGFLPGGKLIHNLVSALNQELEANGHILWLYKP